MNLFLLSSYFGKKLKGIANYSSFTQQGRIDKLELIKKAKTGYRAKFVIKANKLLNKEFFEKINSLPYREAREELKTIPGIGDKIADCILLFAFQKCEAFPTDVWMYKVLKKHYGINIRNYDKIHDFAEEKFGKYAG